MWPPNITVTEAFFVSKLLFNLSLMIIDWALRSLQPVERSEKGWDVIYYEIVGIGYLAICLSALIDL